MHFPHATMAMPGDKEGEHAVFTVLPADKVQKPPSCAASGKGRDRIILANELSMRKIYRGAILRRCRQRSSDFIAQTLDFESFS
jgi:hypothetical protein